MFITPLSFGEGMKKLTEKEIQELRDHGLEYPWMPQKILEVIRRFHDAAKAYQDLTICYRTGRKPSEALFKRLEKARKILDET